jgi:hypothetical protein
MAKYGEKNSARARMCEAANCEAVDHLFTFPKDGRARQWIRFVNDKVCDSSIKGATTSVLLVLLLLLLLLLILLLLVLAFLCYC